MNTPTAVISFFVPGKAEPAGSKRAFNIPGMKFPVVTDDNAKSRPWKQVVSWTARSQYTGPLLTGPIGVHFIFRRLRPKGHYNAKGILSPRFAAARPVTKPDVLKLARGVEDALTGILWHDDAQICQEILDKVYTDDSPGVLVEVWPH